MAQSFTYIGQVYDLSHLADLSYELPIVLRGGVKKSIRVTFRFSCHCFSRSPRKDEEYTQDRVVMDHTRLRLFSVRRYNLSHKLPLLAIELPTKKVYQTAHHNLVHIALVDEFGQETDYRVFFKLRRDKDGVLVVVESAYPIDEIEDKKKYDKPVRFLVAVTKVFEKR